MYLQQQSFPLLLKVTLHCFTRRSGAYEQKTTNISLEVKWEGSRREIRPEKVKKS
jgi:hypothetical protein